MSSMIKNAAREFAEAHFEKAAIKGDIDGVFPEELWQKACELGFIGAFIPEEFGGAGCSLMEEVLIREEFFRAEPGVAQALVSTVAGAEMILINGTEEQKRKFLSPLVKGKGTITEALTHPGIGAIHAITFASRDGDKWKIEGVKTLVKNMDRADYIVLSCITDPWADEEHKYTIFVIDANSKGIKREKVPNFGLRALSISGLIFSNVEASSESLIGGTGEGYEKLMDYFARKRITDAAEAIGIAERALDLEIHHVQERGARGPSMLNLHAVQLQLADLFTELEAAKSLAYKAALQADQGEIDAAFTSMAKCYASKVASKIAIDMMDKRSFCLCPTGECMAERLLRDLKAREYFYEPSIEIDKLEIIDRISKAISEARIK